MFKKLSLTLLAVFIIAGNVFASQVNKTIKSETELNPSLGMTATSDTIYLQDYKDKSIFVNYDETDTGNLISGAVTYEVSYTCTTPDGVWLSGNFYDSAGTTTLQTSETISSDGWYYLTPNPELLAPYGRVKIACTGCVTTNDTLVTVYLVGNK
jgi:hypothetical protein